MSSISDMADRLRRPFAPYESASCIFAPSSALPVTEEVPMRSIAVAASLLMVIALAPHAAADEFAIGPWRLGMSKDGVMAFSKFQRYASIAAKHGLETPNGVLLGEARKVTFMFDDGGLSYIQAWEYAGDNYEAAG